MPWKVKKQDDKYVVVKKESGEVVGTHDTHREARQQVKALYAQEGRKE